MSNRPDQIREFLTFVLNARRVLKRELVSSDDAGVRRIRGPVEDHYLDEDRKPAMYQRIESAIYDDAQALVTLCRFLASYKRDQLRQYQRLLGLELSGLTGDRHPRRIFDRSPLGVAVLVVGTTTIWMTIVSTYSGEDLSELLELIRFDLIAGAIWLVGLFVVLWYILRTVRNNRQVAVLSSISRALAVFLGERESEHSEEARSEFS